MNNRERTAFEAWAKPLFFDMLRMSGDADQYENLITQAAWMAWQRRAEGLTPGVVAGGEVPRG